MPTLTQISPAQFLEWANNNQNATGQKPLLIDVREPWEWQLASVQEGDDFDLLKLSMGNVPGECAALAPDRPTAILCHHGMRSLNVALFLKENGFETLVNISGGIDAWSAIAPDIPRY